MVGDKKIGGSLCAYPDSRRKASGGPVLVIGPAHGNRLRGGMHKAIAAAAVLLFCMKAGRSALTGIFFALTDF